MFQTNPLFWYHSTMRIKERGWAHRWRKTILLATLIAVAAPPVINIDTTRRVIQALRDQPVDCSGGKNGSLKKVPYDIMAIADGGPAQDPNVPGPTTRRNAQAAAIWYVEQYHNGYPPQKIVDLGGLDLQNSNVNRVYFLNEIRKLDPSISIPRGAFVSDTSLNTSQGVQALKDIFSRGHHRKLAAFTTTSQANRFAILACESMPTTVFPSEQFLIRADPTRKPSLQALLNSDDMKQRMKLEKIKILLLPWNTGGDYLTLAKKARNLVRQNPIKTWLAQK